MMFRSRLARLDSLCSQALVLACTALLAAAPTLAQGEIDLADAGAPSGDGVQPFVIDGNPDCAHLGFGFGFKIDGAPFDGDFLLDGSTGGVFTGLGGLPDPNNTFSVFNVVGQFFDWSSTLPLDVVIVKGGPNANIYEYDPEDAGDTLLHPPMNGASPYGISHIEICYDYEVDVTKTADTTYTRTYQWSIDKSVDPAAWDLFTGDTGSSEYTVSVDRVGSIDSDWAVSGDITIENDTPFDATITGVADVISGGISPAVDCGADTPILLAAGDTLVCSYTTGLPDGSARVNNASVATSGNVGGGNATADVAFGDPTTEVLPQVTVTDAFDGGGPQELGQAGATGATFAYERTFGCDADEGSHPNTATIVETGQTDGASVSVTCRDLTVTKTADTFYERDWTWSLDKTSTDVALTLAPGQTYSAGYVVDISASEVDSAFSASGDITIQNNHPTMAAALAAVSDTLSNGVGATVDCGDAALTVPAGGSLQCSWTADLANADALTNSATATLQNTSYGSDGTTAPNGTTDFSSAAVPVSFGDPAVVHDECADIDDSLVGFLLTVCADEAPASVSYTYEIGPYESPDQCGVNEVVNVASFITNDTPDEGSDDHTITVEVPCEEGCSLTPGYWKTHSIHGPAPYDDTWVEIGEDTAFFLSGQSWYEALWTAPRGNAYHVLSHAYIATTLNFLNGASAPAEVLDAWNEATTLFETYTPAEIEALRGNRPPRPRFLELAGLLDMYNNGDLGPGHCDEDSSSAE